MGELKPGWKRVKLGDVAINSTAATKDHEADGFTRYIIGKHIPEDGGRITTWNPVGDAEFGSRIRTMVRAGDVICTTRGPKLKVAMAEFDCLSAHTNFILRPKDCPTFLPTILEAIVRSDGFQDHLRKHFRGSTNLFVNWSDAAQYEFALPPLEEQRRLAVLLRTATETVDASRALVASAKVTRTALRESIIEREQFPMKTVGELCEMQNGRSFPGSEYAKAGVRLLRPANLAQDGTLNWRSERTVFMPEAYLRDAANFIVGSGDVVINLTAQSLDDGFMGRVCFARRGESSLLNQRIGRFVRFRHALLPEYLFRVLQGARFQAYAKAMCEGTKVKHMFWRHIETFRFSLPSLEQQREACEHMNMADRACADAEERFIRARQLATRIVNHTLCGMAP